MSFSAEMKKEIKTRMCTPYSVLRYVVRWMEYGARRRDSGQKCVSSLATGLPIREFKVRRALVCMPRTLDWRLIPILMDFRNNVYGVEHTK